MEELEALRDFVASTLETLEEARAAAREAQADGQADSDNEAQAEANEALDNAKDAYDAAEKDFGADEQKELAELENLRDEVGSSRGKISEYGGPFVDESDFEDYAQELAEDLGAIPRNVAWPCSCIDWTHAAKELRADYSEVEWQGVTYLYRA
jgi:hypothetical protein